MHFDDNVCKDDKSISLSLVVLFNTVPRAHQLSPSFRLGACCPACKSAMTAGSSCLTLADSNLMWLSSCPPSPSMDNGTSTASVVHELIIFRAANLHQIFQVQAAQDGLAGVSFISCLCDGDCSGRHELVDILLA